MLTVKQLLAAKPQNAVYAVRPDHMVIDALELMATRNIGAVLIMVEEQLVGIFSERDYARKGILQDRKAKSTPMEEVMTPGVFTVNLQQNIDDCMRLMSEKKIRHLPVMDDGQVIGLLSVGDIVTAIMNEQKNRIQSLEQYIMAG